MRTISELLGGLLRPLVLAFVLLVGLGLVSDDPTNGRTGAVGFDCRGFTSNAEWNRAICRLDPRRLMNMPISDLVPQWAKDLASGETA